MGMAVNNNSRRGECHYWGHDKKQEVCTGKRERLYMERNLWSLIFAMLAIPCLFFLRYKNGSLLPRGCFHFLDWQSSYRRKIHHLSSVDGLNHNAEIDAVASTRQCSFRPHTSSTSSIHSLIDYSLPAAHYPLKRAIYRQRYERTITSEKESTKTTQGNVQSALKMSVAPPRKGKASIFA